MILKKIKLINWHLFTNETIDIKGNTLLSGENGTGKSTLVDALYYLLSGGDEKHFNHAANQNAKRTLETYMRCKTGIENKEFLRPFANLISHIALVYESSDTKESFTLGVVLELVSGNTKPKPYFYYVPNYEINEEDYISDYVISNYNKLERNIKNLVSLDKNGVKKRREAIARDIFKLQSSEKYFDLLAKAIAFKPIEEVNSFVNSFLLKEKNIDLDSIRTEMRNYKEIYETLVREENKIECLETFITQAIKYGQNLENLKYLNVLSNLADIENLTQDNRKKDSKISENKLKNKELNDLKLSLNENLTNVTKEIALLENNEIRKALNLKEDRLKNIQNEYKNVLSNIQKTDSEVEHEEIIRKEISSKNNFFKLYLEHDYINFIKEIKKFSEEISSKDNEFRNKLARLEIDTKNISDEITEKNNQLNQINKGLRQYKENLNNLIREIKDEIKRQTKLDVDIKPLCEYLEIKDEYKEWSNALEAYLNTQRFDLIVEPKYFNIAIKKYEQIKDKYNIYGYGVVDIEKIETFKENENSLYYCLDINNSYAKKYAMYLLNRVIRVDDTSMLNQNKISITKTCMLYQNYSVRALNKELYLTPYIGRDAINRQKETVISNLNALSAKQHENYKIINLLKETLKKLSFSNARTLCESDNYYLKEQNLSLEIKSLETQIEEDKKNHNLLELENKIENARRKASELGAKIKDIEITINNIIKEIGSLEADIERNKAELLNKENIYNFEMLKIKEDSISYEIYLRKEEEYKTNNSLSKTRIISDKNSAEASNRAMQSVILKGMQVYSQKFKNELVADINSLDDFITEYYNVKNLNIVAYKERSEEAYKKCEQGFRQVFLTGIRNNIYEAQNEIKKLNKNLRRHPFGRDEEVYEFVFKASSDLADYYRIITSGDELYSKDLFTNTLKDSDSALILDLFNKIAQSDLSRETEAYLAKYLDYRSYMNYDIKITNKYDEVSYISKTTREKSGGETQTPFYVVIAACFDELMKKNEDACCLVIFDEAFNNMDEGRINNVLEFYKELSIQLFIVVPGVRTYSIAPYMDSVVGIAKSNNRLILFHEPGK